MTEDATSYGPPFGVGYLSKVTFTLALPRSCTAWFANWVSSHAEAHHEPMAERTGRVEDLVPLVKPDSRRTVFCDSAAPLHIDHILRLFPHAQFVVLRRPFEEVERSLNRAAFHRGVTINPTALPHMQSMLDESVRRVRQARRFMFEIDSASMVDSRQYCSGSGPWALWRFMFPHWDFDAQRHKLLSSMRVELKDPFACTREAKAAFRSALTARGAI